MDLKNYHLRKVCKFWLRHIKHSRHKTKYVMKCMHSVIIEARSPEFDLCRWPANSTDRDSPRGNVSTNLYQISKNLTSWTLVQSFSSDVVLTERRTSGWRCFNKLSAGMRPDWKASRSTTAYEAMIWNFSLLGPLCVNGNTRIGRRDNTSFVRSPSVSAGININTGR
jgi:hypothetical protein